VCYDSQPALADQSLISLGEAITAIDERNVGLVITAIHHTSGQRQFRC
jgi:hypothetical protein